MIWAIFILAFGLFMIRILGDKRTKEKPYQKYRDFKTGKYLDEIPKQSEKRFKRK